MPRLAAFAAIVLWGVSFVATKAVVGELSPATLVFTRAGLGTLLLAGLLRARGRPVLPPRRALPSLALMGFVGVAFHQLLQAQALTLTSAVSAGWLVGLTPLWSALLAWGMRRERLGAWKVLGLLVGFEGALVVVTGGVPAPGRLALPSTRGDLLLLASTLNWAAYTVLGHATIRGLGPTRATAGAMGMGWLLLLPLFVARGGWAEYAHLSPAGWAAVAYLGLASSGLAYLFWYAALERVEASRVAAFLYLEPLTTLGAAVLLLGERASAGSLAGGALVLAGVLLVQAPDHLRALRRPAGRSLE
ncbi:DMT family transporter [Anaeromyxobacter paludicola]|uniref:EamA domain-containing protein n=1 Tax=Anaeromyxobacter paludicola TaxID=2918171 RepID=A0ABN6N674_9BACT|nr:DMT family transporter [Anaeromyxobacter paludicola]BDG08541.1 hypothetical protein AMPC_16540 [Anaeromyxobacter paludicola]